MVLKPFSIDAKQRPKYWTPASEWQAYLAAGTSDEEMNAIRESTDLDGLSVQQSLLNGSNANVVGP